MPRSPGLGALDRRRDQDKGDEHVRIKDASTVRGRGPADIHRHPGRGAMVNGFLDQMHPRARDRHALRTAAGRRSVPPWTDYPVSVYDAYDNPRYDSEQGHGQYHDYGYYTQDGYYRDVHKYIDNTDGYYDWTEVDVYNANGDWVGYEYRDYGDSGEYFSAGFYDQNGDFKIYHEYESYSSSAFDYWYTTDDNTGHVIAGNNYPAFVDNPPLAFINRLRNAIASASYEDLVGKAPVTVQSVAGDLGTVAVQSVLGDLGTAAGYGADPVTGLRVDQVWGGARISQRLHEWDIAFGSALMSDYNFRGITQTNRKPSVAADSIFINPSIAYRFNNALGFTGKAFGGSSVYGGSALPYVTSYGSGTGVQPVVGELGVNPYASYVSNGLNFDRVIGTLPTGALPPPNEANWLHPTPEQLIRFLDIIGNLRVDQSWGGPALQTGYYGGFSPRLGFNVYGQPNPGIQNPPRFQTFPITSSWGVPLNPPDVKLSSPAPNWGLPTLGTVDSVAADLWNSFQPYSGGGGARIAPPMGTSFSPEVDTYLRAIYSPAAGTGASTTTASPMGTQTPDDRNSERRIREALRKFYPDLVYDQSPAPFVPSPRQAREIYAVGIAHGCT
jgi:hypothetical protein